MDDMHSVIKRKSDWCL